MIVEVDPQSKYGLINCCITPHRSTIGYRELECIQGCVLSLNIAGTIFSMPVLNKNGIRAVYCNDCMTIRHLSMFQEYKF